MGRASARGDAGIAALASVQYGLVTRTQLRNLGIGSSAVEYRARVGRLHRIHRGVYAVGHTALDPRARRLAAVLANGSSAVLSHRSAAAQWGFLPEPYGDVEVTVPTRSSRQRPGIVLHRTRLLGSTDRAVREGIPITTPERTIIDLAGILERRQLERALNEAQVLRRVSLEALRQRVAPRAPGRPGVALLRELLAHEEGFTRSELELAFLSLIGAAGLARPEVNAQLARFEVDFLWRARRLVVEVDGFTYHGTAQAFERDRAKGAALQAAGYNLLRFTSRQVRSQPLWVAAHVGAALGGAQDGVRQGRLGEAEDGVRQGRLGEAEGTFG